MTVPDLASLALWLVWLIVLKKWEW